MRTVFTVVLIFFCGIPEAFSFGLTVDEIYRSVVEEETGQTLNPRAPKKEEKASPAPSSGKSEKAAPPEKKTQKAQDFEPEAQWKDIVSAVKKGNVSPFDLAEIRKLSEQEKPEALELLAWMYATGTGVRRDLQKSYVYYVRSARAGVSSAAENARKVYQSMTPAQRASLPAF